MELTKEEKIVLISMVTDCLGIEVLIKLCGEETVSKLDTLSIDMVGNTTPNEMNEIGPSVVKKLVNSVLEDSEYLIVEG
ncbi:hypothetical protein ABE61_04195 [Lysinibacillus sphaericus]|uniref:hypothetical protein n=1 Tax=Lysinibacillus sphaericus TaxID=1421 RepID=UPI0018CFAE08|nr:hypothetical protein [Lysinibacillus sphaericus]MBG9453300.1 hypothetical protein [Lysinibacillus sphaericus]MBG9477096.1 hypothetical protein [Lysinibacillus sphaericus]MBG9591178.1 hypothetical protein [Lysinibacillus sphaericus]MBG9592004.1 hypothetical protein [Lysinibacillus sphaericus]